MRRQCKNWLSEYAEYTQYSEAPDIFHFWTGISVIAGALRRRVWIDQRYFQWTPNFYIFFVAPPGIVSKTVTSSIGMRLLRQVEGVTFGPQVITWQSLVQSLSESTELVEMPDGLQHPMSCLTIAAGELGTLINPQDREMIDVLVSLWDSQVGVFDKSTKTSGKDSIENPWLNIIGCTTPAWIAENVPEYLIGGGFTSRSIFVYADQKRRLVPYPAEIVDEGKMAYHEGRLVHDLRLMADLLRGEYFLSPEAVKFGKEWYARHWAKRPDHMASERYGGYIARKQTHIHKLAMVLAAAESNDMCVQEQHLIDANDFITGIEADMAKVFKSIGLQEESQRLRELLNYIRAYKRITRRDLWRHVMYQFTTLQEFDSAIQSLIDANYIRIMQVGPDIVLLASEDAQTPEAS